MNTMADGARERLVAQIGESLFGQPGLTLMELAEKVKASRGERSWPFVESPGEFAERLRFALNEFPLIGAVRHVLIENPPILVAQPSPAGQGDALAGAILRMADHYAKQADVAGRTVNEAAWLGQIAHELRMLAARQPVASNQVVQNVEQLGVDGQPVGQDPVAWMTHHDEPMLFPTAAEAAAYCEDDEQPVPLFRSPAQAVDLGQFRKQVAELLRREFDLEVADPEDHRHDDGAGEAERIAGNIAALIDSRSAGGQS